jgi:RNA polymerase primary sigma factor
MNNLIIEKKLTNRTRGLDRYFNEINKKKLISVDKEVELADRIKQGDELALQEMVNANLKFVVSVAKQYSGNDSDLLLDLISQGNIGLIDAAKTYDSTRGFKFISYAVWHIRKEMLQHLMNSSRTIRVPQSVSSAMNKAKKIIQKFEQENERDIEHEEIRDILLEMEDKENAAVDFNKARLHFNGQSSLDAPTSDDEGSLHDIIASSEIGNQFLRQDVINRLIEIINACLNPTQAAIVKSRFGLDDGEFKHWTAVAELVGKSPEMSRIIFNKAIKIIQIFAKNNKISIVDFEI